MANVQASEIVAKARIYTAEYVSTGRWSDADILSLADDACVEVALATNFPEATYTATTANGVQQYTLPEIIAILRVYVAGQLIFPTDIPTLAGEQIEYFDQTGTNYSPLWTNATAKAYPVSNDMAAPVSASPYYVGQRPEFYLRGEGVLGLVPPPAGAYTLQIDAIPIPVPLSTGVNVQTYFPHIFLRALAHKTASLMFDADQNDNMANREEMKFQKALQDCIAWKRKFVRNKPRRSYLYPYRLVTYGPWPSSP